MAGMNFQTRSSAARRKYATI
ncbi:MAG: hypothetical protein E7B11_28695 [Clostridiales bacterium]|nr:hypothetical protein [Clostridiales bacterium]